MGRNKALLFQQLPPVVLAINLKRNIYLKLATLSCLTCPVYTCLNDQTNQAVAVVFGEGYVLAISYLNQLHECTCQLRGASEDEFKIKYFKQEYPEHFWVIYY